MRNAILAARRRGSEPSPNGTMIQEFCFRPEDPTFAGHFPTRPLVPGVFLIEMARLTVETAIGSKCTIREISKAKFLRPIIPTETVQVELNLSRQTDMIQAHARMSVGGRPAGEVRLQLVRNP